MVLMSSSAKGIASVRRARIWPWAATATLIPHARSAGQLQKHPATRRRLVPSPTQPSPLSPGFSVVLRLWCRHSGLGSYLSACTVPKPGPVLSRFHFATHDAPAKVSEADHLACHAAIADFPAYCCAPTLAHRRVFVCRVPAAAPLRQPTSVAEPPNPHLPAPHPPQHHAAPHLPPSPTLPRPLAQAIATARRPSGGSSALAGDCRHAAPGYGNRRTTTGERTEARQSLRAQEQ